MLRRVSCGLLIYILLAIILVYLFRNQIFSLGQERVSGSLLVEDLQLFEDPQCLAGCWQNLRPGTTTETELESFLNDNNLLKPATRIVTEFPDEEIYLIEYSNSEIAFHTRHNILVLISFMGLKDLELDRLLEVLGHPSHVHLASASIGHRADPQIGEVVLYYPEQGTVVDFATDIKGTQNGVEVCYDENTRMSTVRIFEPGNIREVLTGNIPYVSHATEQTIESTLSILREWEGYGCFSVMRP